MPTLWIVPREHEKKRLFDAFAKCGKKNLHAGTERVRMAPRRKTVTDRGLLKQGVGSVLFCYKRVNRSRKWNALKEATIWTSNKFDGVKLSSYLPVIPKLWALSRYSGLCCLLKDQRRLVWKGIFITHCRKLWHIRTFAPLHGLSFKQPGAPVPWQARHQRHLSWHVPRLSVKYKVL